MTYKREAGFTVRANLHFEGDGLEDAAYIAQEVVQTGRSAGWVVEGEDEHVLASKVEEILSGFNIGCINLAAGVWGRKVGGSRHFR